MGQNHLTCTKYRTPSHTQKLTFPWPQVFWVILIDPLIIHLGETPNQRTETATLEKKNEWSQHTIPNILCSLLSAQRKSPISVK